MKFKTTLVEVAVIACVCLMLAIPVTSYAVFATTQDAVTVTVNRVERVTTGSGENTRSRYLVFTDSETFQNSDSLFAWKFNSSDLHGRFREGSTYKFHVYGWRVPALSMYRNIVTAEETT